MTEKQSKTDIETIEPPNDRILWWILGTAIGVFGLALLMYRLKFPGDFSTDHAVCGQFGDFMGGLVNPIVGLLTVGMLVLSIRQSNLALRQTSKALAQTKEELELTREAIAQGVHLQEATEKALTRQIALAEETKDISNAMALMKHFEEVFNSLKTKEKRLSVSQKDELSRVRNKLQTSHGQLAEMIGIVELERERLVQKYKLYN